MSLDHASLDLASSHSSDDEESKPSWRDAPALPPLREEEDIHTPTVPASPLKPELPPVIYQGASLWDCGLPPRLGSLGPPYIPPLEVTTPVQNGGTILPWAEEDDGDLRNNLDQPTRGKEGLCHKPNMPPLAASDSEDSNETSV